MRTISLTRGKEAIVDDADYDYLMQWKWCARPVRWRNSPRITWYACRRRRRADGGKRVGNIDMHVQLLGPSSSGQWDHFDGNGLNNQRANLRDATFKENNGNKGLCCANTSGFKGVRWRKGKWEAQISKGNKMFHLGRFFDPKDAARRYDIEAISHFGEFAKTNQMMGLL